MADGNDDDDLHHSLSHMIKFVNVKIGEKFKPPARISLPIEWKPCDPTALLRFQYDFSKERDVIRSIEEERLIQIQSTSIVDNESDNDEPNEDTNEDIDNSDDVPPDVNTVTEILTPMVVLSEGIGSAQESINKKINVEEFEDNNQNPFELVELQTLNEFDELRNVLQPNALGKNKKRELKTGNDVENFELDATFFTQANPPVTSLTNENCIINLTEGNFTSSLNSVTTLKSSVPIEASKGTLNWATFNEMSSPFAPVVNSPAPNDTNHVNPTPGVQRSLSRPMSELGLRSQDKGQFNHPHLDEQCSEQVCHSISSVSNIGMIFSSVPCTDISRKENLHNEEMQFSGGSMHTSKSVPDLNGQSERKHSYNPAASVKNFDNQDSGLSFNIDKTQADNPVATDRINSIMKQFQFQRISNIPTSYNFSSTSQSLNLNSNLPNYTPNCLPPSVVTASYSNPFVIANDVSSIQSTRVNEPTINYQNSYTMPIMTEANSISNPPISTFNPNANSYNPRNPFSLPNTQFNNIPPSLNPHGILPPIGRGYNNVTPTIPSMPHSSLQHSESDSRTGNSSSYSSISSGNKVVSTYKVSSTPLINNNVMLSNDMNGLTTQHTEPKQDLTWLVDPTESLPPEEKKLAYQLSAMGFSLPCVSRAILQLGTDEREVLDFLFMVQELKEKDFNSDDVEMALVNLNGNKEKITSYLETVSTLKEFGFQPLQIHNALKETSCDQQKAIDYLTT